MVQRMTQIVIHCHETQLTEIKHKKSIVTFFPSSIKTIFTMVGVGFACYIAFKNSYEKFSDPPEPIDDISNRCVSANQDRS